MNSTRKMWYPIFRQHHRIRKEVQTYTRVYVCIFAIQEGDTMEITEMLDELKSRARRDEKLRAELLETRKDAQPLSAFCRKCRELGYEIYDMDIITAGEEFYATMRRSTNGGGENSPMLEGEDDFYELFFAGLE